MQIPWCVESVMSAIFKFSVKLLPLSDLEKKLSKRIGGKVGKRTFLGIYCQLISSIIANSVAY